MTIGPIGARIRELRGRVFTQQQLADVAGVSVDLVRKLEQGSRQPLAIADAQRTADYAWGSYWGGSYELLGSILPNALLQLRATARLANPKDRPIAHELLARIYWATGCTLVHLGHTDPAFAAVRLALEAAGQGNDELLAATLRAAVG